MSSPSVIEIQELNPDMIPPITSRFQDPNYNGGCKLVVVGKPGTGKSTLIKSLLYSKKHIFPVGVAMSGLRRYQSCLQANNAQYVCFQLL